MPYNKSKKRQIESESEGEQQVVKKPREKKAKTDLTQGKDAEGNPFWEVRQPILLNSQLHRIAN